MWTWKNALMLSLLTVQLGPGKMKREQKELEKGSFGLSILWVFKSKSSNSDFGQ